MHEYSFVYILASKKDGVLYTGVTSNLPKRMHEHKNGLYEGFSRNYNCKKLVYFEVFDDIVEAIRREKQIKAWKREWKIHHITQNNPEWKDLYEEL